MVISLEITEELFHEYEKLCKKNCRSVKQQMVYELQQSFKFRNGIIQELKNVFSDSEEGDDYDSLAH